ncbi:hypothetical protein DTO063F5_5474 [Paecilomyces variotii]|nr:hypothetical protein DTO063F5_5474 [Paecilomyces variotii]
MASTSISTSTSEQSDNLQSKIPIIILNSDDSSSSSDDDDDDDVQIISVRSVQNNKKNHHGEKNAPGTPDANVFQESITSSQPPKRSRSLERAETNSPPPKRRRSTEPEPQNDPDMLPCNTSRINMGHFNERYESRKNAGTPTHRSDPEDKNNNIHPSPSSPYTKEFFIDLADTISIIFPIGSFASKHNCSPAEVSRAISAVVTSPLLDPELHEFCSWGDGSSSAMSIEDYGRMMVDIWKQRYRKMVIADEETSGGLNGDGGSSENSGMGERDVADVEKRDEPRTTRRWMERDVFGVYVECEPSVEEQPSVIEV